MRANGPRDARTLQASPPRAVRIGIPSDLTAGGHLWVVDPRAASETSPVYLVGPDTDWEEQRVTSGIDTLLAELVAEEDDPDRIQIELPGA